MVKSLFLRAFGDTPILKVLDFFMIHEEFDYSMSEIAKLSGTGYSTLKLLWNDLVKHKLIIHTRNIGKAKLYMLNTKNPTIIQFKKLYWIVIKEKTEKSVIKI